MTGAGFFVLRGTGDGPVYVRRLLPELGAVEWTAIRDEAVLFAHRSEAAYVQECIVAHDGGCAAVVLNGPGST